MTVAGGQIAINGALTFGSETGDRGSLVISQGSLSAQRTILGSIAHGAGTLGAGSITQTGGSFVPGAITVASGSTGAQSDYQFSGGHFRAGSITIAGGGVVTQSGGDGVVTSTLNVTGPEATDPNPQPMQYDISDGTLDIGLGMVINYTNSAPLSGSGHVGGFVQTGGTVTTKDLHITPRGTYEALGGTLNVNGNLLLEGKLDYDGSGVTTNFGANSFADFSHGQLLGTQDVTFTGGPGSLFNFAPGSDPLNQIGHITTQGLIHINGQPLTIPDDRSVGGSGTIQGNVTNAGVLAPGNSPGEIDIIGDYAQGSAANLAMEIAGTASDEFDLLSITGNAQLDGTLSISLLDGFVPSAEDRFTILTAGNLSGDFVNAPQSIDFPGGRFDVLYSSTGVTLTDFQAVPEPAGLVLLSLGWVPVLRRRRSA